MTRSFAVSVGFSLMVLAPAVGVAQNKPAQQQISEAVTPAPAELQAGATVLGYVHGTTLEVIREGTNGVTCLADAPGSERFQVACYEEGLAAFMARGRELRAEGKGTNELREARKSEMEAGKLKITEGAVLWQLFGEINPEKGVPDSVSILTVKYYPYGTPESTGASAERSRSEPWLMDAGLHRAHVMIAGGTQKFP